VQTGFGERAGFDAHEAEDALPSFMWVDAAKVAKDAVDGMDAGRMVVIPGLANRAGSVLAQVSPRSLLVPLLARRHPGLGG
jgi:short-subunit dehydrogenase